MSASGSRPALVQYGRSARKLLAKRASQREPSPMSDDDEPEPPATTTQEPARKRARPDAAADTPRKRAKAAVSDARPPSPRKQAVEATPSPSVPAKRRLPESETTAACPRPSPAKRRTTSSVTRERKDSTSQPAAPAVQKSILTDALPMNVRRPRRNTIPAQALPSPPASGSSPPEEAEKQLPIDAVTAPAPRPTSQKPTPKPIPDPDNIFYTPATKRANPKPTVVEPKIKSPIAPSLTGKAAQPTVISTPAKPTPPKAALPSKSASPLKPTSPSKPAPVVAPTPAKARPAASFPPSNLATDVAQTATKHVPVISSTPRKPAQASNSTAAKPVPAAVATPTNSAPLTPPKLASLSRSPTPIQQPAKPKSTSKPDALSQLFSFSSGSGTSTPRSPTKQGVAKRMLARSKTESSISVDSATGSLSSPSSPARGVGGSPAMLRAYTSLPAVSPASAAPAPAPVASPPRPEMPPAPSTRPTMRTYANARSFLVQLPPSALPADLKLDDESQQSQQDDEIEAELRHTAYSALRDADEAQGLGLATDLRSGTEMREHGTLRRFMDDVGYLLEGMQSAARGVQRSSALEMVEKMADEAFVRKARSADVLSRAWDDFGSMEGGVEDPVLVLCMGMFCAIASREERDLATLVASRHFGAVVTRLLAVEPGRDVLRHADGKMAPDFAKRLGLKRTDIPLMESMRKVVKDASRLFAPTFPTSSPKLASMVLAALSTKNIQQAWMRELVASAAREIKLAGVYLSVHLDGDFMQVDDQTGSSMPDVEHLRHCMRVLDARLLGADAAACEASLSERRAVFASGLVQLCVLCQLLLVDDAEPTIVNDLVDTALRVLVNLTNGSGDWCDALLDDAQCMPLLARLIVSSHQARKTFSTPREGEADPLDRLCLALALLTNLVQGSTRTADAWNVVQIGPACKSESACLRECTCEDQVDALLALHGVYVQQSVKSEADSESPEAQFLHGHLAVLLALLAHQSAHTADVLRREADLPRLVAAGREWVATYELTQRRLGNAQRGVDAVNRAVDALSVMI